MPLSFDRLWQNEEHSDVDVVLIVPQHSEDVEQQHSTQLARLPGHSALLSSSPMINAQILRWQHQETAAEGAPCKRQRILSCGSSTAGKPSTSSTYDSSNRPQLVLELQDASEQAAALVVLQSLYAVAPLERLLRPLRQEQLLQAAMLADKWQVPDVSTAAVRALSSNGLSRALLIHFVQLPAVPTFLLPLLGPVSRACISNSGAGAGMTEDAKRLLLSVLGDLEEVLGDAALRGALLALPPSVVKLLLSSDDLKVASEDTVLAAAREYLKAQKFKFTPSLVAGMLAPLIRCQHLSTFWLSACVCAKDEGLSALFSRYQQPLKPLLMMRLADGDCVLTQEELQDQFEGAPPSWLLGQRALKNVDSVQLVWPLRVAELRSAAQRSAAEQDLVRLECPLTSAPLGGMTWSLLAEADWDADRQAVQLGLFCIPLNAPLNSWYTFRAQLDVEGAPELSHKVSCLRSVSAPTGLGSDLVGSMSGGWDEAAWAATGLPAEGELRVTLTVTAFNNTGGTGDDSDAGPE